MRLEKRIEQMKREVKKAEIRKEVNGDQETRAALSEKKALLDAMQRADAYLDRIAARLRKA